MNLTRENFYLQGYSRFIDINDREARIFLQEHESSFYGPEEEFQMFYGYPLFGPARAIRGAVEKFSEDCAKTILTIDYHEDRRLGEFDIMPSHSRVRPLQALAEVARSYPVIPI